MQVNLGYDIGNQITKFPVKITLRKTFSKKFGPFALT